MENKGEDVTAFAHRNGIKLNYSPAYASESNGSAERLIREHWARARVLLFASNSHTSLWGEAINHGNWLRNRAPSDRLDGGIPILKWNLDTRIDFKQLPEFGQKEHAFIYRPKTTPQKKLLPRTVFGHFVGMESSVPLFRVFVPSTKKIILTRAQDFRPDNSGHLRSMSSPLDGLSREIELDSFEQGSNTQRQEPEHEADLEEQLIAVLTAAHVQSPVAFISKKTLQVPSLPRSFSRACEDAQWTAAINRGFNALIERQTWKLIRRTEHMKRVPYTLVLRVKTLDGSGNILRKARCCVRGDPQQPFTDYDPENTYAPVAAHETLRILFSFAASQDLHVEGADISNAYLYGKLDITIIIEQPTDSSQVQMKPGYVAKVHGLMYRTKQAGKIWGLLLETCLHSWQFQTSSYDARLYFFQRGKAFIIVAIVVYDISFASSSHSLLTWFKEKLSAQFDVKLFGSLSSFIGWEISREPQHIRATQTC